MTETSGKGFYDQWAHWFLSDRSLRTISPWSSITIPEYVERCVQDDTMSSLKEAVALAPASAFALAGLALKILSQDPKNNPRKIGEAEFLSRRALHLAPKDERVLHARSQIMESIVKSPAQRSEE